MRPAWTPTRTYSTADLCALIPTVSPRQLQWWDEHNLVTPRQEEHRRIYTVDDALKVAIIADLRRKGLSLRRIRPVMQRLHREIGKLRSQVLNGRAYIAITGKSFLIETNPVWLLETLALVAHQCCVVDVARQLELLTPDPPKASRATA
jgi:DNA-binding transcriptional MerR regulator